MRPLFVAALALVLALAVPRDAAALSCAQRTRAQQLEGAKVVFVGKVTKNIAVGEARLATFRVSRNFKGTLPGASLVVWYDPSKWQWPFRVGEEYLIFVTASPAATEEKERISPLWTFVCAGDILLTTAEPVVDGRLYLDFHLAPGLYLPNGCMAMTPWVALGGTPRQARARNPSASTPPNLLCMRSWRTRVK